MTWVGKGGVTIFASKSSGSTYSLISISKLSSKDKSLKSSRMSCITSSASSNGFGSPMFSDISLNSLRIPRVG